jgi:uncharacterized protein DUF6285
VDALIMHDNPSGAALLDVARQALMDEIAPALTGRSRYVVLMVANAIGIAMREIEQGAASAEAWDRALETVSGDDDPAAALVQAIRAGWHDADSKLYAALMDTADIAAGIWRPARARGVGGNGPP